jgi:hypothetical protein
MASTLPARVELAHALVIRAASLVVQDPSPVKFDAVSLAEKTDALYTLIQQIYLISTFAHGMHASQENA